MSGYRDPIFAELDALIAEMPPDPPAASGRPPACDPVEVFRRVESGESREQVARACGITPGRVSHIVVEARRAAEK